jgi:hypothetical protein
VKNLLWRGNVNGNGPPSFAEIFPGPTDAVEPFGFALSQNLLSQPQHARLSQRFSQSLHALEQRSQPKAQLHVVIAAQRSTRSRNARKDCPRQDWRRDVTSDGGVSTLVLCFNS